MKCVEVYKTSTLRLSLSTHTFSFRTVRSRTSNQDASTPWASHIAWSASRTQVYLTAKSLEFTSRGKALHSNFWDLKFPQFKVQGFTWARVTALKSKAARFLSLKSALRLSRLNQWSWCAKLIKIKKAVSFRWLKKVFVATQSLSIAASPRTKNSV